MASIIKKKKGKSHYYYAVHSARINGANGKPRIVSQTYLGKAEDIEKKIKMVESDGAVKPYTGKVFSFGVFCIYCIMIFPGIAGRVSRKLQTKIPYFCRNN